VLGLWGADEAARKKRATMKRRTLAYHFVSRNLNSGTTTKTTPIFSGPR